LAMRHHRAAATQHEGHVGQRWEADQLWRRRHRL